MIHTEYRHKKIKIFLPNLEHASFYPGITGHILPFDIESDRFVITHDIRQCDIIPVMLEPNEEFLKYYATCPGKPVVYMMFSHIFETSHLYYEDLVRKWSEVTKNFFIVVTDYAAQTNHPRAFNYDFLWNRQKAYFTEFDDKVKKSPLLNNDTPQRIWTHEASKKMFELPDIVKMDSNHSHIYKKFLSPNRVVEHYMQSRRGMYRSLMSDYLIDQDDTYTSNWMKHIVLDSQEPNILDPGGNNFKGWWPVANRYYSSSLLSVYVETLVTKTDVKTITEKTFDPLIKGHFILPFGYRYMLDDIRQYGFQLPDWIDYSYDSEPDEVRRFYLFTRELLRLREKFTTKELIQKRNQDEHMLHANRQLFFDRPYSSLYNIITKMLKLVV
jgi:hypothetical protein